MKLSSLFLVQSFWKALQEEHRVQGRREFQMLQANICRIAVQPVVMRAAAAANGPNGGAGAAVPATLSPTPRTLYLLWDEYEHGIVGRKAARLFQERKEGESSTSIIEERSFGIA
mgnify:CR=1 FL=1